MMSFTEAMEAAVAKRGADYRFPAQSDNGGYFTPRGGPAYFTAGGEGACLVGAALVELGKSVRHEEGRSAVSVLRELGFDTRTAAAARVAQIHQDGRYTWGESLVMYHEAYAMLEGQDLTALWLIDDLYYKVKAKVMGVDYDPHHRGLNVVSLSEQIAKLNEAMLGLGKVTPLPTFPEFFAAEPKPSPHSVCAEATFPTTDIAEVPKLATGGVITIDGLITSSIYEGPMNYIQNPTLSWTGLLKKDHTLAA